MPDKKTILWVEDDPYYKARIIPMLELAGFAVHEVLDARSAMEHLSAHAAEINLIITDVAMPHEGAFTGIASKAGHETGLLLAGWIHDRFPEIPIVGFSLSSAAEVQRWFTQCGCGFFRKGEEEWTLVGFIKRKLGMAQVRGRQPRIFIVHGHDETAMQELRTFLKTELPQSNVDVLRDLPGQGRTIIEKFEQTAELVDVVFVLLTADDEARAKKVLSGEMKHRARQNVIFELGYFFAKLQRTRGRVIVLCDQCVERPSDIAGIEYLPLAADSSIPRDAIRRELSEWL